MWLGESLPSTAPRLDNLVIQSCQAAISKHFLLEIHVTIARMKAAQITRYKAPLEVVERPIPEPGPGELRIRVHAAGVNPVDYKTRNGDLKRAIAFALPVVPGNEMAGVVDKLGPGAARFAVGDAVFARLAKQAMGGFAEYAVVAEALLAHQPKGLDHVHSACLPLVGLTAWQALTERMKTQPGHRILIHVGAGGVGTVAIQLAKHLGAWVATTCSPRNTELVKSLGADQVIDYTSQDFTREVADLDGVFDMLGDETRLKSFSVLKSGGVLCSIGGLIDVATAREFGLAWPLRFLIGLANRKHDRAARIRGASWSYLFMRPDGAQLAHLASLVEAGTLRPVLDKTYPLADIEAAYQYVASGRARGKVVVTM